MLPPLPLLHDRRGTAVVELALAMPLFLILLYGILGYGQYFLLAHSVQQLANDAARASVAGIDAAERRILAAQAVHAGARSLPETDASRVALATTESGGIVTVRISYDAAAVSLLRHAPVPMPDPLIARSAVVRVSAGP